MESTKHKLDTLVKKYETPDFIKDDPVQFPHRFSSKQDIEISGFVSSAFAYGNRKKIIENLSCIHKTLGASPYDFVMSFGDKPGNAHFKGFCYRFNREDDITNLILVLKQVLNRFNSLEDAFLSGYSPDDKNVKNGLIKFVELMKNSLPCGEECTKSFSHLIPSPIQGSACKRLNLFLKWMVRKGPVDLGLWQNIPADKLIIPLDVHVSRVSRLWEFTERKSDDWRTAEEITEYLKQFSPQDPVRYDFAIFGSGIDRAV